jgi:hypothetical protein
VLKHFSTIGFDFSLYVDACFKTFGTHFLALPITIELLMMFLTEGAKILFRFTYAILKVNKNFIKNLTDPAFLLEELQIISRSKTSFKKIFTLAFKYPLKRKHYEYRKAMSAIDPNSKIGNDFSEFMPNVPKS